MNVYESYTLGEARRSKGYDARKAEQLLAAQNGFVIVQFVHRGSCERLPKPGAGIIQYIKSTGGKWAKSSEIRYGLPLPSDSEPIVAELLVTQTIEDSKAGL